MSLSKLHKNLFQKELKSFFALFQNMIALSVFCWSPDQQRLAQTRSEKELIPS